MCHPQGYSSDSCPWVKWETTERFCTEKQHNLVTLYTVPPAARRLGCGGQEEKQRMSRQCRHEMTMARTRVLTRAREGAVRVMGVCIYIEVSSSWF